MGKKTLNLLYQKRGGTFFNGINKMKEEISNTKTSTSMSIFGEKDEREISRQKAYALFPELDWLVDLNQEITLQQFRNSLKSREIIDEGFQNKILNFTLQDRLSLMWGFTNIISAYLNQDDTIPYIFDAQSFQKNLKPDKNGHVIFTIQSIWRNRNRSNDAFSVNIVVDISPRMVEITTCELTQLSDYEGDDEVYEFIEAHQQNIFMKIITFIRNLLGFNSEIRLEETEREEIWFGKAPSN